MVRDLWSRREMKILEAIAAIEDKGDPFTSFDEVVLGTGLSEADARLGLLALFDADYITGKRPMLTFGMDHSLFWLEEIRLLESGRVATGQWPASDAYDGLLAILDARIAEASDVERTGLTRLRDSLVAVGENVAGAMITDALRRIRDGQF